MNKSYLFLLKRWWSARRCRAGRAIGSCLALCSPLCQICIDSKFTL